MRIEQELKKIASKEKRIVLQSFFKTKPGQYGHGDVFLGVTVPQVRSLIKQFPLKSSSNHNIQITKLLKSKYHEVRLAGVLFLIEHSKIDLKSAKDLYLKNIRRINSWDLVDLSAHKIIGRYYYEKNKSPDLSRKSLENYGDLLEKLVSSKNMWERRVAILSTFWFTKNKNLSPVFKIAKKLLKDSEDLTHKAVGWMLREAGKVDKKRLEQFLLENYSSLPRTTLRYAIERFRPKERLRWLNKNTHK